MKKKFNRLSNQKSSKIHLNETFSNLYEKFIKKLDNNLFNKFDIFYQIDIRG